MVPLGAALAGLLLAGRYAQVVAVLRYLMPGFAAFGAAAVAIIAHVVGAHLNWCRGLSEGIGRARGFYAIQSGGSGGPEHICGPGLVSAGSSRG